MSTESSVWLADNPAARAFLADLTARGEHALEGIGNALARLGELAEQPVSHWLPVAADGQVRLEEARALMDLYRRGMMAAGLVADAAAGVRIFYPAAPVKEGQAGTAFLNGEDVTAGLLGRTATALFAARRIFSRVYTSPSFYQGVLAEERLGLHAGHAEVLWVLERTIEQHMAERLRSNG